MKTTLFTLLLILTTQLVFAQSSAGYTIEGDRPGKKERNTDWTEKIYIGGGLAGLSFSDRITSVGFSVLGGYRWTDRLNTGLGMSYQYFEDKYYDDKYNVFGPQIFAQYLIYGPIFGMAQYEYNILNYNGRNYNYDGLFLGAGYSQSVGKVSINFYLLYNVLYEENNREDGYSSPYSIGANFMVGF
ncbi:hypothetical protein N6H18_08520 [Reichenbachiella agarivorans]|uniref:Outer membrane protein beta-barrel domain-containing protein n=1 Tax=Reichenbachiella agarivorans TaxID=2979464 RepID=A0ABY6CX68_9BACT|nr:hypothetical protein [Reichenbachiella agarivorans]UXP33988.1 hypothetical protein N6H18_08520 [Reichenbachiella agarivorans]